MKKYILLVAMLAMLAVSVSAGITVSNPTIGDDKQDRIANVTGTFTIKNDNAATLSGITITNDADSKYAISISNAPTSLDASQTATVTIEGTIPLDHDAVDSKLKEAAIKVASLTVTGTVSGASQTATADINMQAVNQLRVKKARVDCDGKSESVDDGDKVENLKPGMQCTLEIEVENNFDKDDDDNLKIGDIEFDRVAIDIDSSSRDIDVDEDKDLDGLDADDNDIATFNMDIEDDADDGSNSIDVEVLAVDDNGAKHGEKFDFRMEIDRLTHDVQITRLDVSPSRVSACSNNNVRITTRILNQGKRDEDEAAVEVKVEELKFSKKVEDISLDEDDSTSVNINIPVPEGTKEGVYRAEVQSFFDNLAPSQQSSVDFTVESCEIEEEPEVIVDKKTVKSKTQPSQPSVIVPQGDSQAKAAPRKQSFTNSTGYMALLIVLLIVVAGGVVAAAIMLFKKKPEY